MRILLITSTARGHAIAEALSESSHRPEIVSLCTTANPGIKRLSMHQEVGDILDFELALSLAKRFKPDFAFIGPDDPIGNGIVDILEENGVPCVAPKKALARIESSKGFTRELMKKYHIDFSPRFKVFTLNKGSNMNKFIEQKLEGNYVVKYDALKGGKGVKVSGEHLSTIEEGVSYAKECIAECGRVVIEEKLIGVEFSLLSFVSGTKVVDMPLVQDHKRAFEGDTGPNTGGMGTYSDADHSLPFLSKEDKETASEINRKVAEALLKECGEPYKGILYGGFIAVKDGIRVIEYNARFGDPEALNLLPLLSSDFVDVCQSIIDGSLSEDLVSFERKATVCKYITPKSYPLSKDEKGKDVVFPAIPPNARLYFGDIAENEQGGLHLGGSRAAGIVGIGETIEEAEHIAEGLCRQVQGPVRYRSDIGTEKLISQRVTTLKHIRNTREKSL